MSFILCKAFKFCVAALALADVVCAGVNAADHDSELWLTSEAKFPLDEKWTLKAQVNGRFSNFADRLGQTRIMANLSRDVGNGLVITAGYGHIITRNPDMPNRNEDRLWQSLNWNIDKSDNHSLVLRTQLEQKFIIGDLGWRARQRLFLTRALDENIYIYGSGEGYFQLNNTRWGAQSGFEQLRLGSGVGFTLRDGVVAEIGYLNRLKVVDSAEDKMSHIVGVTMKFQP
ncbi:DUF2490 domain-containing protein [Hyphococcus flavus]|uniref:DUF2490 domain-containing protein n=1 Tax=Hyphococcus flavus TaxID=1866326 RepID=A0AAE9ZA34_9PROT|nr:DUF2490 domain-containing protein [Hyphococcus flavus]WDI30339.1 DUF2490 domain-containing protein [Hyphococcus flavus]